MTPDVNKSEWQTRMYPDFMAVVHEVRGPVLVETILEIVEQRHSDPRFVEGMKILWNFAKADFSRLHERDIRRLAETMEQKSLLDAVAQAAVVAPLDPQFGTARVYEYMEKEKRRPIKTFRTTIEAMEWLGIEAKK